MKTKIVGSHSDSIDQAIYGGRSYLAELAVIDSIS